MHYSASASVQTESKLNARHIRFTFEPNLDIDRIRDVEGNQVRLSAHRAPKATVERYTEQMRAGVIFPAIVVNNKYEIVDGNSRWIASQRAKKDTIAAYICQDLPALQARSLSVELNQTNGLAMTDEEIRAFITGAIEAGQVLDMRTYSRMTGVKAFTLTRWAAVKHFDMRAVQAGFVDSQLKSLSDSARAALNVSKLEAVFVQATALAVAAKVPAAQLKVIITEANAAPSEAEALEVVNRARAARADDIATIACGFKNAPRKSRNSAFHIGSLLRFGVDDLLDVSDERRAETYQRMSELSERLVATLDRARVEWDLGDYPAAAHADVSWPNDLKRIG